jgi:hypothetical protein
MSAPRYCDHCRSPLPMRPVACPPACPFLRHPHEHHKCVTCTWVWHVPIDTRALDIWGNEA